MPICPLCDDTGLQNSDARNPDFCYCAAGKRAKRQWDAEQPGAKRNTSYTRPPSFIDVGQLDQVNASVDAMRATLLGPPTPDSASSSRHAVVQLLYQVAHPDHQVTLSEAAQLHDLAKALEGFLGDLAFISRKKG